MASRHALLQRRNEAEAAKCNGRPCTPLIAATVSLDCDEWDTSDDDETSDGKGDKAAPRSKSPRSQSCVDSERDVSEAAPPSESFDSSFKEPDLDDDVILVVDEEAERYVTQGREDLIVVTPTKPMSEPGLVIDCATLVKKERRVDPSKEIETNSAPCANVSHYVLQPTVPVMGKDTAAVGRNIRSSSALFRGKIKTGDDRIHRHQALNEDRKGISMNCVEMKTVRRARPPSAEVCGEETS